MKNMKNEGVRVGWTAAWLSVAAIVLVAVTTGPYGLGITTDSMVYLQAAKNFVLGNGFTVLSRSGVLEPLTAFPPLYPFFLSIGNFVGMDFLAWAAVLNAALFGGTILLMMMTVFYLTGRRRSALLTGLLGLLSVHMAEAHMRVLSEPVFLCVLMGFLFVFLRYLENRNTRLLMAAAGLAAFSALTRYAGVFLILTGLIVLILRRHPWRDIGMYVVTSMALPFVWYLSGFMFDGQIIGRQVTFHYLAFQKFSVIPDVLSSFLLPVSVPWFLRWLVLGMILVSYVVVFFRSRVANAPVTKNCRALVGGQVTGVFSVVYIASLVFGTLFFGKHVVFSWRMFLPVVVLLMVQVPLFLDQQNLEPTGKRLRGFSTIFVILFLAMGFLRTVRLVKDIFRGNYSCSVGVFSSTEMAKNVRSLADDVPVYTDDVTEFYYLAGRSAVKIPVQGEDLSYLPSFVQIRHDFMARRAVAIIFHENAPEHSDWVDFGKNLPLSVFFKEGAGSILGFRVNPLKGSAADGT